MAKKKKLESKAPVPMTRGQLSRAQRERQQIRNLYAIGIGVASLVILILAFAILSTYVVKPNQQVARVNNTVVTRATYNKLRRWNIFQQMQQAAFQQQLSGSSGGTTVQSGDITAYQQQLQNVDSESSLDQDTINTLIDNEVLRQKSASDFNINPTQDELKAAAVKDFIPQPTPPATPVPAQSPTPTSTFKPSTTPTPTATATVGTPTDTPTVTPTLPPVPGASATAQSVYTQYIISIDKPTAPQAGDVLCQNGCPNLAESDYLNLVIEPRVRQQQVTDKLAATKIVTDVEQIHAQQILTDTQAGAQKILDELKKGANWLTVSKQQSKDPSKATGGDVGWFPQQGSNLVQPFVDAAFKVPVGQMSDPVQTQFGWHIIKVLEKDPKRPLTADQLSTQKTNLYNDWFDKAKASCQIEPVPATPTAVATQPAIVEPTSPPTSPSPAASAPAGSQSPGTTPASSPTAEAPSSIRGTATPPAAADTPTVAKSPPTPSP